MRLTSLAITGCVACSSGAANEAIAAPASPPPTATASAVPANPSPAALPSSGESEPPFEGQPGCRFREAANAATAASNSFAKKGDADASSFYATQASQLRDQMD